MPTSLVAFLRPNGLANRPLCQHWVHLHITRLLICGSEAVSPFVAGVVGFEPTDGSAPPTDFKSAAFDHSAKLPYKSAVFDGNGKNPLLSGWVVPHIGFTTNNHRQYPPFRRLIGINLLGASDGARSRNPLLGRQIL